MSCAWTPSMSKETIPPRSSPAGGPKIGQPGNLGDPLQRVGGELSLGGMDRGQPELVDPPDCRTESDRLADRGGAALELRGQIGPGDQLLGDLADHRAAADEGGHLVEQLAAAEEGADTGGSVHLVAGHGVEVGSEPGHVQLQLRPGLGTVHDQESPGVVREPGDLLDRVDRAQHVRDMRDGDELRALLEERREGVHVEPAVAVDRRPIEVGVLLLGHLVPGHDVRVVLHLGDHDPVAGLEVGAAP